MKLSPTLSSLKFKKWEKTLIFKKYIDPISLGLPYAIPKETKKEFKELIASKNGCLIRDLFELFGLDEPYSKNINPITNINILIVTCIF